MIKSRLANKILVGLGLVLVGYVAAGWIAEFSQNGLRSVDPYQLIASVVLLALGVWCTAGGTRNLRVAHDYAHERPEPVTVTLAKVDLIILGISALSALASWLAAAERLTLTFYYLALIAFGGAFVILAAHVVVRMRHRETIRREDRA